MTEMRTDWHAIGAQEAMSRLGTRRAGLSEDEAQERLAKHGPNALPAAKGRSRLARLLGQFNNLLIYVLIGAGIVTALLGHVTDTAVILAVVVVNALIGYWQEGRAEDALSAVRRMLTTEASVRRGGCRHRLPAADLVPGDIVLLEAGDRVPADLRLIEARGLRAQEAALTGESVPVDKMPAPVDPQASLGDRASMAYSGTLITSGRGMGTVAATGQEAEIGRIGAMLGEIETVKTPLLTQIDRFAKILTFIILGVCALVFFFAVYARDYAAEEAFLAMVGMAVAAIPEGLPAVLTITLALGVQRMASRRAIVRRLPAVETLGAVSVICTDKTGTLTFNEMVARTLIAAHDGAKITASGEGYAPAGHLFAEGGVPEGAGRLVLAGVLCNDARLVHDEEAGWQVAGDPMEGALLALGAKAGLSPPETKAKHERLDDIPFDAERRYMAILAAEETQQGSVRTIFAKGAPGRILDMCDRQLTSSGEVAPLDRKAWSGRSDALAAQGQRLLAFACKAADTEQVGEADMEGGFLLLGLIGFIDPPRPEAVKAAKDCRRAGIEVKMITGDHALTALAIAGELGLATEAGALTGAEIETMDEETLRKKVTEVAVFARAAPAHKLRLVEALQQERRVVAMTGDGVNDAPALKRADVGVAMGIKGTEAAKEAAKVVLADDNFASIVAAVREGRTIYDNIQKVIAWNLPTNGGESLIIISAIFMGIALPMTPVQILWINMVTAVALGLTLAFEPPEPAVMERAPRRAGAALLNGEMVWRVVLVSVLFALAVFWIFFKGQREGEPLAYTRTLVVNLIVVMEIFYLFSVRYLHLTSMTRVGVLGTRAVLGGVGLTIALQLAFTYAPPLQAVFDTRPVSLFDGGLIIGIGAVLLLFLEAEKFARRRLSRRRGAA